MLNKFFWKTAKGLKSLRSWFKFNNLAKNMVKKIKEKN